MGNTFPKLHQVIGNAYNSDPNTTHGETITLFDAYHKATKWFFHHMNNLVLFIRYIQSLETLELSVLIASLSHFSPYFLLFRRHHIPPSSITTQMDQVVDLDSPTTWVKVIAKRVALFMRVMPMAMDNLSIAQHRNTLRYAHPQGSNYKPKVRQFDVGDFVYFQWQLNDALNTSFGRTILRIKAIRPSGMLELQGGNGRTI